VRAGWVLQQERLDRLFAPLSYSTIELAAPMTGEHVLDIGCGCGATVIDLARRVGASGRVTGVDIAADALARAKERIADEGLSSRVTLTLADAEKQPFSSESTDLIFSRLGVMFFGDPVAAFINLRSALKPSGRMAFVCPRTPAENRWLSIGIAAAKSVLPTAVIPAPWPDRTGMFSFADPARVSSILEGAGFHDIGCIDHDLPMWLGGPGESPEAASFLTKVVGPLPRIVAKLDPELQQAVLDAVTESLQREQGPQGIVLDGAFWMVTARA
jgi:SAM-dependent methyltransferase